MTTKQHTLVLVRHGHSEWNLHDRFTGWTDILLTKIGLNEANNCGKLLAKHGFQFDEIHQSVLQRTHQTAEQILLGAGHMSIPRFSDWRLNERHYGCLQGMSKIEIFKTWGEQQSYAWWRGYETPPPALDDDDPRHPRLDPLYNNVKRELLPYSESLQQCQQRTLDYWEQQIVPRIKSGKRLLIVSHGNTMRALCMQIEKISVHDVEQLEIPAAEPLVYHFNKDMELLNAKWLK